MTVRQHCWPTKDIARAAWAFSLFSILSLSAIPGQRPAARAARHPGSAPVLGGQRVRAMRAAYGMSPLRFERNRGQATGDIRFLARGPGYTLAFGPRAVTLALVSAARPRTQGTGTKAHTDDFSGARRAAHPVGVASGPATLPPQAAGTESIVQLQFVGANAHPHIVGLDRLPGAASYFVGADRRRWRADVPAYARVAYRDLYPGIDLVYYGAQGQLEYDWTLRPGAHPTAIRLAVATPDGQSGAERVQVDRTGDLVLRLPGGDLRQRRPHAYQWVAGRKVAVAARYAWLGPGEVGIRVGRYDAHRPLIIDPTLIYSTHLGGSDTDGAAGIAVDAAGAAYVVGWTSSLDFPTAAAYQGHTGGRDYSPCPCAATNVFVSKLSADGGSLVYSTYLGGAGPDVGHAIAVDAAGDAYITGDSVLGGFPTTTGAYTVQPLGNQDFGFVAALNARGDGLLYSTYLGSAYTPGDGITLDGSGDAYVTGATSSLAFPTTPSAAATSGGGFVIKFGPGGSVSYSTYLAGAGAGIAVDGTGAAYVTGGSFVTKLSADGHRVVYSAGIGGAGAGITVAGGDAYVAGYTESPGIATPGAYDRYYAGHGDAFVTKLDAGGGIAYATYLGGGDYDGGTGIAVDARGDAYATGFTRSATFPTDDRPFGGGMCYGGDLDQGRDVPCPDAFVIELDPTGGSLLYSTFLGGGDDDEGQGIALNAAGDVYVAGTTMSADFPLEHALYGPSACDGHTVWSCEDAFVAKLSVSGPSATATATVTPTMTATPTTTAVPTATPTATATATTLVPAATPTLTSTPTPIGAGAMVTTVAPPPTDTPFASASSTVPVNATAPATPLPTSPPTTGPSTMVAPPIRTAMVGDATTNTPTITVPAVGSTRSTPRATVPTPVLTTRAATAKRHGVPPGLSLDTRPLRAVAAGETATLSIRTAPYAHIKATLSVTGTAHSALTAKAAHAPPKPSARRRSLRGHTVTVTLYRVTARGRADRRGWITLRLHVAYTPAHPVPATLTLVARSGRIMSTRRMRVTINPKRPTMAHGRTLRRYVPGAKSG